MRYLIIFLLLTFAANAFANDDELTLDSPPAETIKKPAPAKLKVSLALAISAFVERSKNTESYVAHPTLGLRLGGELGNHEILVEADGFKDHSGTSGVDISRFHQQIDVWYHYLFFADSTTGHPYLGGGVGGQRDVVTTNFFGSSDDDYGQFLTELSLCGGYRFGTENLAVWLEVRATTSSNYDPKVIPSALLAVGLRL